MKSNLIRSAHAEAALGRLSVGQSATGMGAVHLDQDALFRIDIAVNRNSVGKLAKTSNQWRKHLRTFKTERLSVLDIADAIYRGHAIAPVHQGQLKVNNFVSTQFIGLDFDTEDERSRVENLKDNPFIRTHASIVHTTSGHTEAKPRARVIFILDKPIDDAATAVRYATAMVAKFEDADKVCTDATRLWFGAKDCEIQVCADNVLPLSVLDELLAEYPSDKFVSAKCPIDARSRSDTELLKHALSAAAQGNRNNTGFTLACRLRDAGFRREDAIGVMLNYQEQVPRGSHPYTPSEATNSCASAYSQPPRSQNMTIIENVLRTLERAALQDDVGLKPGALHYSLKTVYGVIAIARKANRIENLALPARAFNEYGVSTMTASRHLRAMCDDKLLILIAEANGPRAAVYSISLDRLLDWVNATDAASGAASGSATPSVHALAESDGAPPCKECTIVTPYPYPQDATAAVFHELQNSPLFRHRATVDARLSDKKLPDSRLGPPAQRLIAVLATTEPTSKRELYQSAKVNARTGKRILKLLEALNITTYEYNPANELAHMPRLCENWYERLREIEPALTTYGHETLLAERVDRERLAFHKSIVSSGEQDHAISNKMLNAVRKRLLLYPQQLAVLLQRRKEMAAQHGVTNVPELSLLRATRDKGRNIQT